MSHQVLEADIDDVDDFLVIARLARATGEPTLPRTQWATFAAPTPAAAMKRLQASANSSAIVTFAMMSLGVALLVRDWDGSRWIGSVIAVVALLVVAFIGVRPLRGIWEVQKRERDAYYAIHALSSFLQAVGADANTWPGTDIWKAVIEEPTHGTFDITWSNTEHSCLLTINHAGDTTHARLMITADSAADAAHVDAGRTHRADPRQ